MEDLISHVRGTRKFNIAMLTTKSALPILNQNSMATKVQKDTNMGEIKQILKCM